MPVDKAEIDKIKRTMWIHAVAGVLAILTTTFVAVTSWFLAYTYSSYAMGAIAVIFSALGIILTLTEVEAYVRGVRADKSIVNMRANTEATRYKASMEAALREANTALDYAKDDGLTVESHLGKCSATVIKIKSVISILQAELNKSEAGHG